MVGKIEKARALLSAQIECARNDIATVASQQLESRRSRVTGTFGPITEKDSALVRQVRAALDERKQLIASIRNGEGNPETRQHIIKLAEKRLRLLNPEASKTLQDAALAEKRLLEFISRMKDSNDSDITAYSGSITDAVLFEPDPSLLGVRLAEVETANGESRMVAMIDDPDWSKERTLVRLSPSPEGPYRAIALNNSISVNAPKSVVQTNNEIEAELDDRFAAIMNEYDDFGLWEENSITARVVMNLRDGKQPRTFIYKIDERWVAVRLKITKQRGRAEHHLGDLCLIIEQLNSPDDDPRKTGVAAVEAKKRDYINGLLQALDPEQADRILRSTPLARLLIYDAHAFKGWHAACMPLFEYGRLRPGAESEILKSLGIPFSQQLTRQFFLNRDLEFDPYIIENAFENFDKYTFSGFGGVAVSSNREQAMQQAQRETAIEIRLMSLEFERNQQMERSLNMERTLGREQEGPEIGLRGPSFGI
jgi:hypothetical protein